MTQAAARRTFYLWSSFDPPHHQGRSSSQPHEHQCLNYAGQAYFDLTEPQRCQLFLYTNVPTYGALMAAREVGDASVAWLNHEPESPLFALGLKRTPEGQGPVTCP